MTEWKIYRLGDIATMKYGKLPPQNSCGQYPIWSGYRNVGFTDTYNCSKGTIIVVARGVGGTGDVKIAKEDCFLTNLSIAVNIDTDICLPQYFYYKFYLSNLRYLDSGSAQSQITIDDLKRLQISLPGLEEQRRIAGILSAIDDKIENNRRINANLELQAQALFEEWRESCSKTITIKELADNILDYTPNANSKVVLLNSSDVTQGLFAELPLVDNVNLKGQFKKRFQKDDILYSEIRPRNKHYAYCYFDSDRYIASTRLIVLRGKKEKIVSNTLLYQYLISQTVFEEFTLKTETRSGTFPQGNYQDLSSIVVPYSDNQKEIAGSLDVIYEEIWSNYKENETLATLRDTLLPKLMNGEIITK